MSASVIQVIPTIARHHTTKTVEEFELACDASGGNADRKAADACLDTDF